jgi:Cof subfamily protein (haloacid dehalogenase superfamily)
MGIAYRLLAVDVDGTLLNSSNRLPHANREALHRAHDAGLIICLCTGRSYTETRPVIDEIGLDLDVAVCVFGAVVSEARTGRTIHRWPIPRRATLRLLEFFSSRGHPVLVLHDVTQAATDYYLVTGRRSMNMEAYDRWLGLAPTLTRRVEQWPEEAPDPLRIGIIVDPTAVGAVKAELDAEFAATELKCNAIFAPNYGLHVVECFAPQVNKWYATSRLARDRGIRPSEIVAIGDDVNDLEMIRSAGMGVAVANAIPAVRDAARCHTGSNNDAGVAAFVDRLLAGEVHAG